RLMGDVRQKPFVSFRFFAEYLLDRHKLSPMAPQLVLTFVERDSIDPGAKRRLGPETPKTAMRLQKNGLHRVLCPQRVTQHVQGQVVDSIAMKLIKLPEGIQVASLCFNDESVLISLFLPASSHC